jgi:hypothetical protein
MDRTVTPAPMSVCTFSPRSKYRRSSASEESSLPASARPGDRHAASAPSWRPAAFHRLSSRPPPMDLACVRASLPFGHSAPLRQDLAAGGNRSGDLNVNITTRRIKDENQTATHQPQPPHRACRCRRDTGCWVRGRRADRHGGTRIGTPSFSNGYPSQETVARLYDELDF